MREALSLSEWRIAERWLLAAYDVEQEDREAFLVAHCPDRYRDLVARLLRSATDEEETHDLTLSQDTLRLLTDCAKDEPAPDAPVEQVGTYRLIRPLGRGGMADVYLARPIAEPTSSPVAIKLLRSDLYDAEADRRFRRERIILATLLHDGIAALLDAGSSLEGWPYFALEYVEGEHIVDFSRSRSLTLSDRLNLFEQLCDAVAFAHEQQIVHCDLKPTNVLVTSSGRVKVIDFGIAKVLRPDMWRDQEEGTSFLFSDQPCEGAHTPVYSAPEVRNADRTLGPEADVYSLGVLGRVLLQGTYPAADQYSSFTGVWDRAMADRPSMRYRTASELLATVREARTKASGPQFPNSQLPGASGSSLR